MDEETNQYSTQSHPTTQEESAPYPLVVTCKCCRTPVAHRRQNAVTTIDSKRLADPFLCPSCESVRELSSSSNPHRYSVDDEFRLTSSGVIQMQKGPRLVERVLHIINKISDHVTTGRRLFIFLLVFSYCLSDVAAVYWK